MSNVYNSYLAQLFILIAGFIAGNISFKANFCCLIVDSEIPLTYLVKAFYTDVKSIHVTI